VIEVRNGRIRRVRGLAPPAHATLVAHSLTVGWRMLGLSVRGFHRVDELVIEQSLDGVDWTRHPIPPLDEGMVDLSTPGPDSVLWYERVIGSPLGTLFVRRAVVGDRVGLLDASGVPSPTPVDVVSEVVWDDVVAQRWRSRAGTSGPPRSWRGASAAVCRVRSAVERSLVELPPSTPAASRRARELLDAMQVFRAMTNRLRGSSEWRELWRPSIGRSS
jgi:hypothetical protein